ncbi:MAG: head maturation protease, ClpP-related [Sulfitobacter sp.]|jgi:ATP-dependent protease ClpP protease subunit
MSDREFIHNGEIILSGEVIDDDFAAWGFPGFAPMDVRTALAAFEGEPVTIRLNSIGGFATEGEAIRALIARHDGDVTIVIEGSAQSAASLLALGADRVEISAGSFVMIHDPSGGVWGTAEQHRATAEALDVLADGYAAVYAAKLGVTAEAAREIMKAETYYSAADAVALGFADAISGADPEIMPAAVALGDPAAMLADAQAAAATMAAAYQTFKAGGQPAQMQTPAAKRGAKKEPLKMAPKTPLPTPAPAAPDAAAIALQARNDERARSSAIRAAASPFVASGSLTEADVEAYIDIDVTAEAAKAAMLDRVSERQVAAASGGQRAQITRDETDTKLEGIISAMSGGKDGPAAEYRGMRAKSLARMLGGSGGHNEAEIIKRGMSSTAMTGGALGVSDFSHITSEVMRRTLVSEYDRRAPNWDAITGTPISAADFRELAPTSFGGDFQLKPVAANGEYQVAKLEDKGEGLKVERRGRTIILTFEAVINDDMSAFARIPNQFAMAARQMENSMVWALIRSNAKLKSDDKALFHADHGNLITPGTAISVTSMGNMRKKMWDQKAFGAKAADDFLQITPNLLIVPPALETVALQFVAGTTPGKDSDANPYKGTMTPIVVPELGAQASGGSDKAWYVASSDMPAINVANLSGYEGPTVEIEEGMNPDRVVMNARHIFGAGTGEAKGMAKNVGA